MPDDPDDLLVAPSLALYHATLRALEVFRPPPEEAPRTLH